MESRLVTATGGKPRREDPPLAPHLPFLRRATTADARAGASCSGYDGERWWARMRQPGMERVHGEPARIRRGHLRSAHPSGGHLESAARGRRSGPAEVQGAGEGVRRPSQRQ
ncbi:unnamed protein product [Urochloa humidicola]